VSSITRWKYGSAAVGLRKVSSSVMPSSKWLVGRGESISFSRPRGAVEFVFAEAVSGESSAIPRMVNDAVGGFGDFEAVAMHAVWRRLRGRAFKENSGCGGLGGHFCVRRRRGTIARPGGGADWAWRGVQNRLVRLGT